MDVSGSDTSLALIAAQELSLPTSAIYVTHDNTDSMPYSGLSAGSKTTYTVGAAAREAARDVRSQLFAIAAEMLEASPDDMELQMGKVQVKGVPEKHVTLQQIAANSMRFGAPYEPVYGRGIGVFKDAVVGHQGHHRWNVMPLEDVRSCSTRHSTALFRRCVVLAGP